MTIRYHSRPRAYSRVSRGGLYRNFHLRIRPATLESSPAVSGPVIGHYAQHVLARLVEGGGGGRPTAEYGPGRRMELGFFHRGLVTSERHRARPAELAPGHRHR